MRVDSARVSRTGRAASWWPLRTRRASPPRSSARDRPAAPRRDREGGAGSSARPGRRPREPRASAAVHDSCRPLRSWSDLMRRVVLVLADGLRPDAITPTDMPSLDALARTYTTALRASTIRPSRTVAALASLATGVAPTTHGLIEPGLGFLARLPTLRPLARELTRGGVSSQVVASELLPAERAVLWALTKAAGLGKYRSAGLRARDVAPAARPLRLSPSDCL